MREVIDDGPDREPAMHVKGGPEFARREQKSVDPPQPLGFDIDEQPRAAFAAGDAGIALQFPTHRIAADDLDRSSGIDGFGRIGASMHRLTVVAMAVELHDGLSGDFNLDRSAATLDVGHSFCSD
jgi:hypothetical protein